MYMNKPKIEDINTGLLHTKTFKKRYPEFYKFLMDNYLDCKSLSEKLYLYYNNLSERPKCLVCGTEVKFDGFFRGFRKHCSLKCSNNDINTIKKLKQTNLERYGVENPIQNKTIKEKIKQTNLERYGVVNPFSSDIIKEKIKQTNLERYGFRSPLQNDCIKEKIKQTNLERYGVEYPMQNDFIKEKSISAQQESNIESHPDLIRYDNNGDWICKCPHSDCDKCDEKEYIIDNINHYNRKIWNSEPCTKLLPIKSLYSTYEIQIRNFLDIFNIEYEINDRVILAPKELDIYIPSKKIAIEFNGCYWHSDVTKRKNYHIDKFLECKDKGIQLIQIWEDWMINKPDIIWSFLKAKLGLYEDSIYARKCNIIELDSKTSNKFLKENHIQGGCNSNYRIGLMYNNDLVAVMCFNKRSKLSGPKSINSMESELIRFCNKKGTRVVGGASKLLKYYIKRFNPDLITSYSCNDISNGQLYKSLGFSSNNKISSSYWYIEPLTFKRKHRTSFTRYGISRKWSEFDIKDQSWTERSVMDSKGYLRIYDSGTTRWELKFKSYTQKGS